MRIPTSVFVMSLLTAAPFGLAIRDTLKDKPPGDDDAELDFGGDYGRDRARYRREMAEYEAEMAREAAREAEDRARRREERLTTLDSLYGSQPASMGSLLSGIVIGADAGSFQPEAARSRIERATSDGFLNVVFDVDASHLRGVKLEISADYDSDGSFDPCTTLREKLTTAWGRPATGSTWVDRSLHQRASLDDALCTLAFERYLEPTEWVTALPFDAIGKSAEKFAATLGPAAEVEDDMIYWRVPGAGYGRGDTQLEAYITKGKVVAVKAIVNADFDSVLAVRDALTAKLKSPPKQDPDVEEYWEWKRKVPVVVDGSSGTGRVVVVVGTIPWE